MPPRKITDVIRIELDAGNASSMEVGKALGPKGVNMAQFIAAYNAATADRRGDRVPAVISVYEDRSFSFVTKTPPTAFLLRRAAGLAKGSEKPNGAPVGSITSTQLRRIAQEKLPDLNAYDIEAAAKIVLGTARSMGISVRD